MLADSAACAAGEGAAPKRRGRPKKSQAVDAADADGEAAAPKPRGRKKKEPVAGDSGAAEAAEAAPAKKTRKKKVAEADAGGINNLKLAFDEGQARQQMVRVIGLTIILLLHGTARMMARPLQLLPC